MKKLILLKKWKKEAQTKRSQCHSQMIWRNLISVTVFVCFEFNCSREPSRAAAGEQYKKKVKRSQIIEFIGIYSSEN